MSSTLSADAKDALARDVPAAAHCRDALRDALLTFGVAPGTNVFRTQRASVARLLWTLLDGKAGRTMRKTAGTRLRRLPVYEVAAGDVPAPHKAAARCDRRMALRGAFLACGSLAAPARGYHLEFVPPSDEAREFLVALLRSEGRTPKVATRKSHRVVYFKGIDEIAQVLASIGASHAVLRLEDVRALKETKNRIHRLVNTEAANVERAAGAAAVQREAIAFVADAYGLRNLSAPLREVAELRLSYPTETLAELGRRCNPPAKKSTVNGRLAAILRLGRRLRDGNASAARLKGSANPSR